MRRRSKRRIKVADAAEVVAALQSWARQDHGAGSAPDQWIQAAAGLMVERWADSPVVLRVDVEFAGALMNSNTDVELVPDWLDRFPFNAMAYSLAAPLSLHDGHKLCHYIGMLVSGINTMNLTGSQPSPLPDRAEAKLFAAAGSQFTRYVNIPAAQGVRCLWVFKEDGDPAPQLAGKASVRRLMW